MSGYTEVPTGRRRRTFPMSNNGSNGWTVISAIVGAVVAAAAVAALVLGIVSIVRINDDTVDGNMIENLKITGILDKSMMTDEIPPPWYIAGGDQGDPPSLARSVRSINGRSVMTETLAIETTSVITSNAMETHILLDADLSKYVNKDFHIYSETDNEDQVVITSPGVYWDKQQTKTIIKFDPCPGAFVVFRVVDATKIMIKSARSINICNSNAEMCVVYEQENSRTINFPLHLIGNLSLPTEVETFTLTLHRDGGVDCSFQEGDGDISFPNTTKPDDDVETGFHGVWDQKADGTFKIGMSGMRAGLNPICGIVDGSQPYPNNNTITTGIWQCTMVAYIEGTYDPATLRFEGAMMIGVEPAFDHRVDGSTIRSIYDITGGFLGGFHVAAISRNINLYDMVSTRDFDGFVLVFPPGLP